MMARDYDNLARDYGNYALEEQVQELSAQQKVQEHINPDSCCRLRRRLGILAMICFVAYAATVMRSASLAAYNSELVSLRRAETQLINKNNELKIEVEQLKGPDRIIGFAEHKLGMNVARSNIYLKSDKAQNAGNTLAMANK